MAIVYKYEGGAQITISGDEFDCVMKHFKPWWLNMIHNHALRQIVYAWQALRNSSLIAMFDLSEESLLLFLDACEIKGVPITAGVGDGKPVELPALPRI